MQWNGYTKSQKITPTTQTLTAAGVVGTEFEANGATGIRVDVKVSALTGTSVTPTLEYYDEGEAAWRTLIAAAAQTGAGHVTIRVHPAITVVAASGANVAASDIVPKRLRLSLAVNTLTTVAINACYTLI